MVSEAINGGVCDVTARKAVIQGPASTHPDGPLPVSAFYGLGVFDANSQE